VLTPVFLFVIAFLGGALNAVAGGGSFIALPALIYTGVGPVAANATTTLAMWPGSFASAIAYRREISVERSWLLSLGGVSLVGGLLGGALLVKTSDTTFLGLLPWLMLAAVATFTFGGAITARWPASRSMSRPVPQRENALGAPAWILALQLAIAIYGGYFGGGMGIMMLAAFSIAGMTDIHRMNGLKAVLSVAINGVALIAFIIDGAIVWRPGLVMVAGGIAGGYLGALIATKVGVPVVRWFVVGVGWLMTAYFFWR
jgi:uncharacterized protein